MNLPANYWVVHKRVLTHELDALSPKERAVIIENPESDEAIAFDKLVRRLVEIQTTSPDKY